MKLRHLLTGALLACLVPTLAFAEGVVVIVSKANANAIDKALVAKIYTGESRTWAGGGSIASFDLPEDNLLRDDFDGSIVGKSMTSLKALWSQAATDDDVKKAVAANKNAIGYIQARNADDTVKVVLH